MLCHKGGEAGLSWGGPFVGTCHVQLGQRKAHLEMPQEQFAILEIGWQQNGKG